ncbi:toprim domain-containing protein, partial [Thiolapillus sp.]|uniref:toprim domain-containing protein n=1 Tax=Thiolapillus sp. TaxID=2017437 RepID=UPI003AF50FF1
MSGWYSQAKIKLKDGGTGQAIRFEISDSCYWARLLDHKDIRCNGGSKAKIVGPYKGEGWSPPGQIINQGDEVWITEGIFKSCALSLLGKKTISGLSANNLPIKLIELHDGHDITWVIALDNDNAGRTSSLDYKKKLRHLGKKVLVALPNSSEDWDDAYRRRRKNIEGQWIEYLSDDYLQQSLWRGAFHTATSAPEKAFWLYIKGNRGRMVFDYG